jgi:hypothetical protein
MVRLRGDFLTLTVSAPPAAARCGAWPQFDGRAAQVIGDTYTELISVSD